MDTAIHVVVGGLVVPSEELNTSLSYWASAEEPPASCPPALRLNVGTEAAIVSTTLTVDIFPSTFWITKVKDGAYELLSFFETEPHAFFPSFAERDRLEAAALDAYEARVARYEQSVAEMFYTFSEAGIVLSMPTSLLSSGTVRSRSRRTLLGHAVLASGMLVVFDSPETGVGLSAADLEKAIIGPDVKSPTKDEALDLRRRADLTMVIPIEPVAREMAALDSIIQEVSRDMQWMQRGGHYSGSPGKHHRGRKGQRWK